MLDIKHLENNLKDLVGKSRIRKGPTAIVTVPRPRAAGFVCLILAEQVSVASAKALVLSS